jgi:hypothetical protein
MGILLLHSNCGGTCNIGQVKYFVSLFGHQGGEAESKMRPKQAEAGPHVYDRLQP